MPVEAGGPAAPEGPREERDLDPIDHVELGAVERLVLDPVFARLAQVDRGADATCDAVLNQARQMLGRELRAPLRVQRLLTEKRATFRCTPGLQRPPASVAPCLHAAGDYVDGPYPATLEGAVRSGVAAARSFG